jgi:hypothetical protein
MDVIFATRRGCGEDRRAEPRGKAFPLLKAIIRTPVIHR